MAYTMAWFTETKAPRGACYELPLSQLTRWASLKCQQDFMRNKWLGDSGRENLSQKEGCIRPHDLINPKGRGVVRFGDMVLFKEAPLECQGWRLTQSSDDLCVKLLAFWDGGSIYHGAWLLEVRPNSEGVHEKTKSIFDRISGSKTWRAKSVEAYGHISRKKYRRALFQLQDKPTTLLHYIIDVAEENLCSHW